MPTVHRFKVTLKNTRPSIWREVLVPSDLRLDRLHELIQIVMGWEDAHLHEFSNGQRGPGELRFGPPRDEFDDGMAPKLRDENKATLLDLAPAKGDKFVYWYDFGDDWFHEISVRAVDDPKPGTPAPICLKAVGACPPEDCGGPWGYARMLEVLRDPKHAEYDEMREWIGDDWNPERYDVVGINQALAAVAAHWNRAPPKLPKSKIKGN